MSTPPITLRPATPADVDDIVAMIRELAVFEKLEHMVVLTPQMLSAQLFGARPAAEVVMAELDRVVQGFALYFHNFSTFRGQPGLYLEDLYVRPAARGCGLGRAVLSHLGALAVERGCGRFEWSVLDWNEGAICFYEKMGATVMHDWRICRIAGPALEAFGRGVS
ncbi:MAG: GNAT family N-acetyltransferase [Pseudomonadota bacterium]|nr:GNAT family N-acetyltransferase [Pseudomonadota bacterium]